MTDNKDIFISILEKGISNGIEGTSYQAIYSIAKELNYFSEEEYTIINKGEKSKLSDSTKIKKRNLDALFEEAFPRNITTNLPNNIPLRSLSYDSYFKYLEFIELAEARKNSKSAQKNSIWAIAIALFSLITSIVIPFIISKSEQENKIQIEQPIQIENEHLPTLINKVDSLKKSIDSINKNKKPIEIKIEKKNTTPNKG